MRGDQVQDEASARWEAEIPTYPDLAGKVAVITGGSGGIGAATCRLLAANGASVGVNGRNEAAIERVVVTDYAAVEEMRVRIEDEFGPTDLVFAFAGGGKVRPGPSAGITEDDWRSSVDGSLTATFLTIKSFLPGMIERGGSIVTMASSAARIPTDAPAPYAAAKAGVVMLTRQLASEVGERQGELPGPAHDPHGAYTRRHARGASSANSGRDSAGPAWNARGRRARRALSRVGRLVLDHGRHARCVGRQDHALINPGYRGEDRAGKPNTRRGRQFMSDQTQNVMTLGEDWAAAELRGDTSFLAEILAEDFVGVGPRGFMLTREQWLSRHERGSLKYEAFELDEVQVRLYGDAALTVCRQIARGAYEDENGRFELDDQFRATLFFVTQDGRWRLAGLQLSPILGRP
jgi:3-oxoacyl-[acyl-carrier protein] reductase